MSLPSGSIITGAVPGPTRSIFFAAAYERSRSRPATKGPRSLTTHSTSLLFLGLVTSNRVPKGYSLCAQVSAYMLNNSPDDVGLPLKSGPYQEARTVLLSPFVSCNAGGRYS